MDCFPLSDTEVHCKALGRKKLPCQQGQEHRWGTDFSSACLISSWRIPSVAQESWPFLPTVKPHRTPTTGPHHPPWGREGGGSPSCKSAWARSSAWGAQPCWKGPCAPSPQMIRVAFLPSSGSTRTSNMLQFRGELNRSFVRKHLHGKMMEIKIGGTKIEIPKQNKHL